MTKTAVALALDGDEAIGRGDEVVDELVREDAEAAGRRLGRCSHRPDAEVAQWHAAELVRARAGAVELAG